MVWCPHGSLQIGKDRIYRLVCDSRSNLYTTVKTYAPGVIPFKDTEDIDLSLHLLRKLPLLNRQIVQLKDQITLNF